MNKEGLRNCHRAELTKKTYLNAMQYPGLGAGTEKDISRETGEI